MINSILIGTILVLLFAISKIWLNDRGAIKALEEQNEKLERALRAATSDRLDLIRYKLHRGDYSDNSWQQEGGK